MGTELANLYRENRRIEGHINRAQEILQRTKGIEQAVRHLELYQEKRKERSVLEKYRQEFRTAFQRGKGAEEAILNAEKAIRQYGDEYGTLLEGLGKCPLCFSDITQRLLKGF